MDYAVHAVETAVALQPIDEDEIGDCITALSHLGRRDAARSLLDMQPKTGRFQIAFGVLDEKQGRYKEALAYYTSAHELDPKAELPLHKLISLYRRSGAFAVAHSMVDRLSALDKRHESATWHLRAQIHSAAGDRVAAIAVLQRGLELAPYFEASVIDLARELRRQRKLDEAHAVLSRYPPTYGLLLALSDLELGRRDHEAALRHTTAAQALEPRKPDALIRAVRIEADRRGYAAALARVDQIDALGPEYHVTALRSRTHILRATGEHQEVLRLLKEMAAIHPADAAIMMDLARQYRAVGDRAAAQGTIAIALEREPDNVTVLAEAGHFANAQDDRVTALRYFRRIMEIAPDQVGHYSKHSA
jgi:tetratricopeptide (TPR) repeat protein